MVDANDAVWNELHIWQDANSDGITQADEWFTMADLGITAINMPVTGNAGSVVMDGGAVLTQGVIINTDGSNTRYAGDVEIDFATLFLPELRGFNELPDLRIGMSLDADMLAQAPRREARSVARAAF